MEWWCIKLWVITSLGSVQVVGFFDDAARLRSCDRPVASCSRSLQHCMVL